MELPVLRTDSCSVKLLPPSSQCSNWEISETERVLFAVMGFQIWNAFSVKGEALPTEIDRRKTKERGIRSQREGRFVSDNRAQQYCVFQFSNSSKMSALMVSLLTRDVYLLQGWRDLQKGQCRVEGAGWKGGDDIKYLRSANTRPFKQNNALLCSCRPQYQTVVRLQRASKLGRNNMQQQVVCLKGRLYHHKLTGPD